MPPEFNGSTPMGELYQLKGNQSFFLHPPQTVWVVQSGEVGLFWVAMQEGMAIGARRYLFSCTAGEALFGIVPDDHQPSGQLYGLLAVALEETTLLRVEHENLEAWLAAANPAVTPLLETWMQHCRSLLETTDDDRASLGQVLHKRASERPLFAADALTNLETLLQCNAQCLAYIEQFEVQEQTADWSRFQMQDRFNQQTSEGAIASLASLLNPASGDDARFASPPDLSDAQVQYLALYKAAQRVAQALGLSLQLPAKSENLARLKEPLDAIARASRVRIRRVLLSDRWWRNDCGPLLAYLRPENRPVALIASAPGRYQLFDPVTGAYTPVNAVTQAQLFSVAYVFYRPLPERITQLLGVLHFGLKGSARDWSVIVWAGIATTLLGMLLPQCTAILIDQAIPDANHTLLIQLGLGLLAAIVGGLIFQLAQGVALMRIETLVEASTQTALWDRLLSLGAPFFRQYSVGDLRERVAVMGSIRHQITGVVLRTLFTSTFALLNLALLFYYSPSLALVAVAVAAIVGIVTIALGSVMLRQVPPLQALEGKIFGLMVQLINGVAKLRVTGAEARAFAHWGKQYSHQQTLKLKRQQLEDTLLMFNQLLPITSALALFAVATRPLVVAQTTGGLSTGTFLAFNVAFGSFIVGVTELSNSVLHSLMAIALWKRAQPILQAKPEVDSGKTEPGQLSGNITLSHITFRYRADGPATLDDVTIEVKKQEFVAIVGPSGSGKSTLFRLLLGFETPQVGQVYYDSQDLRSLNIHSVRRQLGVLLQNSRTSTASIFENIAGNALITMDEAWEAAHYAGLDDEINAMPMGMHTVVSEGGSNLSGGQRQRLLIARSLALKPRILLFDEATSALDSRTQTIVSESLERLQITRIVIAHRLSTIRNADRIYVLQAGRIVQQGCFDALIEQDGVFRQLMQQQIA